MNELQAYYLGEMVWAELRAQDIDKFTTQGLFSLVDCNEELA